MAAINLFVASTFAIAFAADVGEQRANAKYGAALRELPAGVHVDGGGAGPLRSAAGRRAAVMMNGSSRFIGPARRQEANPCLS
jgi:hypothetical protein